MNTFTSYFKISFLCFFLCCFSTNEGHSSHIIGGFFSYTANPNKVNNFDIKFTLIRDELSHGARFDPSIDIQIFTHEGSGNFDHVETIQFIYLDSVRIKVQKQFTNNELKVEYGTYQFNYDIPDPNKDYYFVFQRCCMDSMIHNLDSTLYRGLSFIGNITSSGIKSKNNSVLFKVLPNIIAKTNSFTMIKLDVKDKDGDIIITEFDHLLIGGGRDSINLCSVVIPDGPCPPPYKQIDYSQFDALYKWDNLNLANLKNTIEGTPREESFNIYAIRINEYRNGILLGSNLIYLPLWVVDDWPIATDDTYKGRFNLYPNPTDHTFNIEAEDAIKSIRVFNSNGELILQEDPQADDYQLELDQPSGIYFVHVIFEKGMIIKKLIKY